MTDLMTSQRLTVGVLGGMGPEATIDFMAKVLVATPAREDQDHLRLLVDQNPALPSRQLSLAGMGENPGPRLAAMAKGLEIAGADFLVMPCNTAHAFADQIDGTTQIPLISIIAETVAACGGLESIGLLATAGCLNTGVYQSAFAESGHQLLLPSAPELEEFTRLVTAIKIGEQGPDIVGPMLDLATAFVNRGAHAVVAGCTEIPLVLDESMLDVPLISSTDVLAEATVAIATGVRKLR